MVSPPLPLSLFGAQPRPQRDDLLELERQLAKLGLESKTGGPGGRARHRAGTGKPGAHLSSALGESFCLLNQSVIFGGGLGVAAGGTAGGGYVGVSNTNGGVLSPRALPPPQTPQRQPSSAVPTPTTSGRSARVDEGPGPTARDDSVAIGPSQAAGRVAAGSSDERGVGEETVAGRGDRTQGNSGATALTARGGGGNGRRVVGRKEEAPAELSGVGDERRLGGADRGPRTRGGGGSGDEQTFSSGSDEARRAREEEEAQQGEIMRLLTCLKTLGDENVSLMKECEDRDKARRIYRETGVGGDRGKRGG